MKTQESFGPILVLAETPGAWDSVFTCNPKVIGGAFEDPLGNGNNYQYAMYYVGTFLLSGLNNSIGVAFSNDGIHWEKYPQPIISPTSPNGYGLGQPALYNKDRKASIEMFYEESVPTPRHIVAVSMDGVHFATEGILTSEGLDSDDPLASWGDMAYDSIAKDWYAVFNRPLRPPSVTGGIPERGQYGIELYKIPQATLLTGASPWTQLVTADTSLTGLESNFIAGFVRDPYGNVDVTNGLIEMYTSVSYPAPRWDASPIEAATSAQPGNWILLPMKLGTNLEAELPLNRYSNGDTHIVTTGWISADGGFQLEQTLGHLHRAPFPGATMPFYGCKAGSTDYFISTDVDCGGQRILGKEGYAYARPIAGLNLTALYGCSTKQDHFVSKDPKCEGQKVDELLGYVLP